jgi:alpha-methylacyl-CoA racemase
MSSSPLSGIRILDLTRLLPGPAATLHLADLGADVIKIEDPGTGDYARQLGPKRGDTSWFFEIVNRGKSSLTLDLKQSAGVEVFLRLARDADVVVESFRPGVVDRLGVGYAAVRAVNPRIVYCAVTGYGQTGPYRDRAGHDINYIGYAGVLDQTGAADGPPVVPNFPVADLLGGGMSAAFATVAALFGARTTGQGRYVDIAMTDVVLAHNYFPLLSVLAEGKAPPRGRDLFSGGVPCYGVYPTADGRFMAVGALEEKFWSGLCLALQRPDLLPLRLAEGAEGAFAREQLTGIFRSRTQAEWTAMFAGVDCCVSPVLRLDETLDDPQVRAREMVADVGGAPQFASPFRMDGAAPAPARPAPARGADSEAILGAAGYSAAEIDSLRRQGVI